MNLSNIREAFLAKMPDGCMIHTTSKGMESVLKAAHGDHTIYVYIQKDGFNIEQIHIILFDNPTTFKEYMFSDEVEAGEFVAKLLKDIVNGID